MKYEIEIREKADKDLRHITKDEAKRITAKVINLENGLTGDIKKLTNYKPEYRLRVGDYRVLFEVEGSKIIIYRILHRREAYR